MIKLVFQIYEPLNLFKKYYGYQMFPKQENNVKKKILTVLKIYIYNNYTC